MCQGSLYLTITIAPIDVKSCRYHAIERDISIISVTKSIRGTSTFHCEQACDYEKEFNCRSYTYLDNPDGSVAPGGNLCLLSADNRATSHQGSMQFRPRALYAEKDCAYQKWPKHATANTQSHSPASQIRFYDSTSSSLAKPFSSDRPEQVQLNPRNMLDEPSPFNGPMGATFDANSFQVNSSHSSASVSQPNVDDISQLQHIPARCGPNDYSFEKTFGYDLRYAHRERAPIPSRPGLVNYCKEECVQRGEQCLAFVIEYGSKQQQNCYFLDEAASEHRNRLNKLAGSSYNEKICLRGIDHSGT